jgi:hypothetical protein
MNQQDNPTLLEKLSGNLVAQTVLTGLATYIGSPLAALLPVLSESLASRRHSKRVEKALSEINNMLLAQNEKIKNISDSQYKIINETILTILQTTEDEKIEYLKKIIEKSINEEGIPFTDSSQLSRIIRDISVEEIIFLSKTISRYSRIVFIEDTTIKSDLYVEPKSHDSTLAAGLISMGLLVPTKPTIDNIGSYQFSPLAKKMLKILST